MGGQPFDAATLTISGNTITNSVGGGGGSYALDLSRSSNLFSIAQKGFLGMSSNNDGAAKRGRRSRQRASGHVFDPASIDWSTVSDATARATYGKVTYKITDNTFVNMNQPWDIRDTHGADVVLTGNIANLTSGISKSVVGMVKQQNAFYSVAITMSDNTLTASNGEYAYLVFDCETIPVKSVITVSKNVITTGKLTGATILQLPSATILPEENPAKFTVSGNRLVALDGTTGIQANTFVVYYDEEHVNYYGTFSPNSPMTLCNNVVLGTLIDTDELTESTFYYADERIPLTPVSKCPALSGASSAPYFGAARGVLFSATAAMAIAALA